MDSRPPAWHLLWLPAAHRAAPQSPCVTFWADPTPGAALVSSASGPQLPSCSGPSQTLFRPLSHASSWVVPPRVPLSWHSAQAGYMSAPPSSNLTPQQGLLGRGHPPPALWPPLCFITVCVSPCRVRLFATPWTVVRGILQPRILEWVALPFSRGSSHPRVRTQVSCIAGGFFTSWATRKAPCHHLTCSVSY